MYLSELKIWNFRKYGTGENNLPGLQLKFNKGLNLLVGENDSGKTTIIDAIKFVLQTQSHDYLHLEEEDFFLAANNNRTKTIKIECIFKGFDPENNEAANFIEWLGIENIDGQEQYFLKVTFNAERKERKIIYDINAGPDEERYCQ